jgi:L-ascorbate metabolism protein UlaG (beta-lactamase superfamily)
MQLPSDVRRGPDDPDRISVTWLGHATFLMRSPKGVRILFDPWLTGNPSCPEKASRMTAVDLMLVTHGHSDHTTDAVAIGRATGAVVMAVFELAQWLGKQGLRDVRGMNIGGRAQFRGIDVTMVPAVHSSSVDEGTACRYLGVASGFIIRWENGSVWYFAGDTALFGDMRILRERYSPVVAFLPIGDRYTMGPEDAAIAGEWLGVKRIVPMHYGTFPELTGTPDQLRSHCKPRGIDVLELRPGEAITI